MVLENNITLNDIVDVLSNIKLSDEDKATWIHLNNVTTEDLIDAVNYVTIERNFYKRRCGFVKIETTNNDK